MCGIVGYIGKPARLPRCCWTDCQSWSTADTIRPEIAVYDGNKIQMQKAMGRLKVL